MAPVNQNMKNKGNLATNSGKDRQANTPPGVPNKLNRERRKALGGSVGEGQSKPAFKDKGKFARNGAKYNQTNQRPGGVNTQKRKWVPEHKVFEGSVGEGQGFAFRRKQKVQHEYNKLLRKERRKHAPVRTFYRDEFPDHLSHLYKAEAEKLYDEARTSRIKRTQCRMGVVVEEVLEDGQTEQALSTDARPGLVSPATQQPLPPPGLTPDQAAPATQQPLPPPGLTPDQAGPATQQPEPSPASDAYSLPMSNRQRKKQLKKTSFQKTKEEFESIKEKRAKKKEEFLKDKQQREEAIHKYKQKKKETFKVLNTKTKKGQPNLNVQMEYLLQKIQGTGK